MIGGLEYRQELGFFEPTAVTHSLFELIARASKDCRNNAQAPPLLKVRLGLAATPREKRICGKKWATGNERQERLTRVDGKNRKHQNVKRKERARRNGLCVTQRELMNPTDDARTKGSFTRCKKNKRIYDILCGRVGKPFLASTSTFFLAKAMCLWLAGYELHERDFPPITTVTSCVAEQTFLPAASRRLLIAWNSSFQPHRRTTMRRRNVLPETTGMLTSETKNSVLRPPLPLPPTEPGWTSLPIIKTLGWPQKPCLHVTDVLFSASFRRFRSNDE